MFHGLASLRIACSRSDSASSFRSGIVSRFISHSVRKVSKTQGAGATANVEKLKKVRGAPRQLTVGAGKSGGRNSAGRITAFHRGGGAKRLQRIVDTKRNILSVGVIQRIDYDPNRSSRLALVRWVDETSAENQNTVDTNSRPASHCLNVDPTRNVPCGRFSLSALYDRPDERTVSRLTSKPLTSHLMVGHSLGKTSAKTEVAFEGNVLEKTKARDIFLQSFSARAKQDRSSHPFSDLQLPRIAVAGAKPLLSASKVLGEFQTKSSNLDVSSWKLGSNYWAHRIKRKAAVSWKNLEIC